MTFVLDTSLTLSWYFEDERTPASDALLGQLSDVGAVVPSLWRLEVANGFQTAIRRKRIGPAYRDEALHQLSCLPITLDPETNTYAWTTTLSFAQRFGLTPYDAAYLELAQRRTLPLATLDQELRGAASSMGMTLLGLAA